MTDFGEKYRPTFELNERRKNGTDQKLEQVSIDSLPAMSVSSKIKQEIHRPSAGGLRSKQKETTSQTKNKLMEKRINSKVYQQGRPASFTKRGSSIRSGARWIYRRLPDLIIYSYAFLYMYTGWAKFNNMTAFIRGNGKIPHLGPYAKLIGYGIPSLEIVLAILLIVPVYQIKRFALWTSTSLMAIFTIYLSLMVQFVEKKLCHCGGVIESMGWKTHIAFNIIWLIAGLYALKRTKL